MFKPIKPIVGPLYHTKATPSLKIGFSFDKVDDLGHGICCAQVEIVHNMTEATNIIESGNKRYQE